MVHFGLIPAWPVVPFQADYCEHLVRPASSEHCMHYILYSSKRFSGLISRLFLSSPEVGYFSKDPWFLSVDNDNRNSLGAERDCSLDVFVSRPLQMTDFGNVLKNMN